MADSYEIVDGQVIPFHGGRRDTNTDTWRDATPLELQLQEQVQELEEELGSYEKVKELLSRAAPLVRVIVNAKDRQEEQEACRALAKLYNDDLDSFLAEEWEKVGG